MPQQGLPQYYEGDIQEQRDINPTTPKRENIRHRYLGDSSGPADAPPELRTQRDNRYAATNTSYSGADIRAIAHVGDRYKVFANLQTLSYSVHREKTPVRTLGISYPKGYVRGPRTLAGSLIFTVFDRHVLFELMQFYQQDPPDQITHLPLADMMPPFDITITFTNEYGHQSVMRLYGIELMDEGQTMSIDDMITENTMSYVARNIEIMISDDHRGLVGREGDVIFNRGIFTAFSGMDTATLNRQQQLLNRLAKLQVRLARDIPTLRESDDTVVATNAVAEQDDILAEINRIKAVLEAGVVGSLYLSTRTPLSSTEYYNIPWDYRNIRHEGDAIRRPYNPSRKSSTRI